MKKHVQIAAALLAIATLSVQAQTTLTTGHLDLGIAYENGGWDLHVHDELNDIEYEPDDVILYVGAGASNNVPANALFSFLGNPGGPSGFCRRAAIPTCCSLASAPMRLTAGFS
jgi:hypothetical protein